MSENDHDSDKSMRRADQKTVRQRAQVDEVPVGGSIRQFYQHTPLNLQTLPGEERWSQITEAGREGRYEVGDEIGHGGMGVVRVVTDVNLGRRVAMKSLLAKHAQDPNLIQALINEARLTGQLEHPSIVPIYELGVSVAGTPYYTMKLLDRSSLREILQARIEGDAAVNEEYTLHRLLNIFGQVCMGCHYAHSRGVVHRDIKPENILIGNFGEVLVVDWGIARVFRRKGGEIAADLSDQGMIVGTPTYMSPEQARGDSHVDQRSDVFSLGMILYEVITGRLPIDHKESERWDTVPGGELPELKFEFEDRKIPAELVRICRKAVEVQAEHRYQSARELWKEVDDFLEGSKERERMHQYALAEVARGDESWALYFELQREKNELEKRLEREAKQLLPWHSIAKKQRWWEDHMRLTSLELMVSRAFSEAVKFYHRALGYEGANESARAGLGTLYWARFVQAEEERNFADQVYFGNLAQEIGGTLGEERATEGTVNVRTVPDGVTIYLVPYDEISSELTYERRHRVGVSPVGNVLRVAGGYLVVATKEGYRDAHQPLFVQPGETHHLLMTLSPWFAEIPLVGREYELRALKSVLHDCVELREARACALVGSAGVGKGRLLHAFNQYINDADDLYNYMYVECRPLSQLLPFSSLVEMVRHRAGLGTGEGFAVVEQKVTEMVTLAFSNFGEHALDERELREVASIVSTLLDLPAFDVVDERRSGRVETSDIDYRARVLDAMATLVERLAGGAPVVMIAKDAQWMDYSSREFFRQLLERVRDLPLLVLATVGVDTSVVDASTKPLPNAELQLGFPFSMQLRLGPLSPGATRELIREMLKGPVTDIAVEVIAKGIEHSPFYIQDYLHFLAKQQYLVQERGRWTVPSPEAIPDFDEAIPVRLLLDELGDEAGTFLKQAAVVGEVFWIEVVPTSISRRGLDDLVTREVIFERATSRYPGTRELKFKSRAARRVLYSMVEPNDRSRIHRAAAEWIEHHGRIDLEESMRLAWHLERGGEGARAAEIYYRITRVVEQVGGVKEASVHLRQALRLDPDARRREAMDEKLRLLESGDV
ncbi:MAG: protein kinase [Myxococcales bacterium]|nr:protein kinase [Myxococcales bacterium]